MDNYTDTSTEYLTLYRGEYSGNKGGRHYSTDFEFAKLFTQSGKASEVATVKIRKRDVHVPSPIPYAGDEEAMDAAVAEATKLGKSAVMLSEGTGQPNSVYIINKSALVRRASVGNNKHIAPEYLYHGTSEGGFRRIRINGLLPQNGYIYFSSTPEYALSYAKRKGNPYGDRLLRVKNRNGFFEDENTGLKGDYRTDAKITPSEIEVSVMGEWVPIQSYHNQEINIMPLANTTITNWYKRAQAETTSQTKYYHGTPYTGVAEKVLSEGLTPPDLSSKERNFLRPVEGKVYMTKSLRYAIIYCLGGDMLGHALPEKWVTENPYGYVFEIAEENMSNNIQPDEDSIGELIYNKKFYWLNDLAKRIVAPSRLERLMRGEYIYFASVGKQLMKYLENWQKQEILESDEAHIAHSGTVSPTKAWRFDKKKSVLLKKDGSNFFELAERVL
jgi:hypothetical protein